MKKWLFVTLAMILTFTSIPSVYALEMITVPKNRVSRAHPTENKQPTPTVTENVYHSVTASVYGKQEMIDPQLVADLYTLMGKLQLSKDWLNDEWGKGYLLQHVYQGLQAKQQGKDYETFMKRTYPNPTRDLKIRFHESRALFKEQQYLLLMGRFSVTREWIQAKERAGCELYCIFEELEAKQQGKSGEEGEKHPHPTVPPLTGVTDSVYGTTVTGNVYGTRKKRTVTDSVYGAVPKPRSAMKLILTVCLCLLVYQESNLLHALDQKYDELALRRQPIRLDQAPYAVGTGNAQISTIDGSLRYAETDMVLPGHNGLNFELRRIYDSAMAKDEIYFNHQENKNATRPLQEQQSIFHLGMGWKWDMSYIKDQNGSSYIYISGLGTYELSEHKQLKGYPFSDLSFGTSTHVTALGVEANYELRNKKTGITQYFSQGRLVEIKDKYGNWIGFEYKNQDPYYHVLSSIKSSNGKRTHTNEMSISYNYDKRTIAIQAGSRTVTYKKEKVQNGDQEVLKEVTDALGRTTSYEYNQGLTKFNFDWNWRSLREGSTERSIYWGHSLTCMLEKIKHPTKAETVFNYDTTYRKIGDYAEEEVVRYTEQGHQKQEDGSINHPLWLTYVEDVGEHFDQDFTFSTKVDDGLKTSYYKYDYKVRKSGWGERYRPLVYLTETHIIDRKGNSRRFNYEYDKEKEENPHPINIREWRNTYGIDGSLFLETKRTYDHDRGVMTEETDPLGYTTSYEYRDSLFGIYRLIVSRRDMGGGKKLYTHHGYDDDILREITLTVDVTDGNGNKKKIHTQMAYEPLTGLATAYTFSPYNLRW